MTLGTRSTQTTGAIFSPTILFLLFFLHLHLLINPGVLLAPGIGCTEANGIGLSSYFTWLFLLKKLLSATWSLVRHDFDV